MNIERWLRTKRPSWERLDQLVHVIDGKGQVALSRLELQEFGRLYRSASADLSCARALKLNQEIQIYLNNLVVKAHNQVYQTRNNRWRDLLDFLSYGFPWLVRKNIAYVGLATFIFALSMAVSYIYVLSDIHFAQLEFIKGHPLVSEDIWQTVERHKMWTDSSADMGPLMSMFIASNNIRVAVSAFVFGITFGLGTVFILCQNGLSIGTILGVCQHYGMAGPALVFVASHGVLELVSIFISAAGGLLMGKALLFPGQWSRINSLRLVAKDALKLFGGCIPLLMIAGLIEGFISPRTDFSANTKLTVSLVTFFCLMIYLFVPWSKSKTAQS